MSTPEKSDTPNDKIDFEKRYKDTQSSFTKSQQDLSEERKARLALEAKLKVYEGQMSPVVNLSDEQKEELEDLKLTDPEAWRTKLNALEIESKEHLNSLLREEEQKATQQYESRTQSQILSDFNTAHPDLELSADILEMEIPLRITNKLKQGKITYSQYLEESYKYIKAPKVIGDGNKTMEQPNFNKSGGSDTPVNNKQIKSIVDVWSNANI